MALTMPPMLSKPPIAYVECPDETCTETLAVPVEVTFEESPGCKGDEIIYMVRVNPDLADLWAHAWTHNQ